MSKYIKLEDAISEADRLLGMVPDTDFDDGIEHGIETMKFVLADLPTIDVCEDAISREDAIKAYNEAVDELVKTEMEEFNLGDFTECSFNTTQLKLIARKIEDAPSVIPQVPSEDCISKTTALEIYSDLYWIDERLLNFKSELDKVYDELRNAPPVMPKPKEGEWIRQGISPHEGIQICSLCGAMYDITAEFDNCPNCHAKMKGAEE